jgi:predicted enzyme related to lactoylglutathione lyase
MLKFNSLLLFSEKPDTLAEFYKKVFDKDPDFSEGGYSGFQLGHGMIVVGPHDKVKGENKTPERMLINFETEDVAGNFERIKKQGAKVIKEPYDPGEGAGASIATFADPDGNYFQLTSPMKMDN